MKLPIHPHFWILAINRSACSIFNKKCFLCCVHFCFLVRHVVFLLPSNLREGSTCRDIISPMPLIVISKEAFRGILEAINQVCSTFMYFFTYTLCSDSISNLFSRLGHVDDPLYNCLNHVTY